MENINALVKELRDNKIKIVLNGENLEITSNAETIPQEILLKLKKFKPELINYLSKLSLPETYEIIPKASDGANFPLSSSQYRTWITIQLEKSSIAYNIPNAVEFIGTIDIDLFFESIFKVIERHESLRTVFITNDEGEIRQRVIPSAQFKFNPLYTDLRQDSQKDTRLNQFIANLTKINFDLENGPLISMHLIQMEDTRSVFMYTIHHLISDGWSMEVLKRDLFVYYNARGQSQNVDLPLLGIQYKDYAVWQQNHLNGKSMDKHREYWAEKLSGLLPIVELPTEKKRPLIKTYNGDRLMFVIGSDSCKKLKHFCRERNATLFTGLLAAVKSAICLYTNQNDIIVGTPVAGRDHADLKDQIGYYINTLPIRTQFGKEQSFQEIFSAVKLSVFDAFNHQAYPLEVLVNDLNIKRDASRSSLFDILVSLQTESEFLSRNFDGADFEAKSVNFGHDYTKFDLAVKFTDESDSIKLNIDFNTDIYEQSLINQFGNHLIELIDLFVRSADTPIKKLEFLSTEEKNELLADFNNLRGPIPDETIVSIFEKQVDHTPLNLALKFNDTVLSYKDLNALSNQFANYLLSEYNITPGEVVGILLERNEWLIISIIAILKTGSIFLPQDTEHPEERTAFIQTNSQCKFTIHNEIIYDFLRSRKLYKDENLNYPVNSTSPAYLIYTSGSTGTPKGAVTSHRSIINYNNWFTNRFDIGSDDSSVLLSSFVFSGVYTSVFCTLLAGGALHIVPKIILQNVDFLSDYIRKENITFLKITPAHLHLLVHYGNFINDGQSSLRLIVIGGDKIKVGDLRYLLQAKQTQILYHYGASETTMGSLTYEISSNNVEEFISRPKVGTPILNGKVYIMNSSRVLVPKGVAGEIYIGGAGLSSGYYNDPEATKLNFIDNPYHPGEKLFKSGDVGRMLNDFTIELLGRSDNQVKIRGYRIELGEIESALQSHPDVNSSVVLARSGVDEAKELVCYLTGNSIINVADIRSWLGSKLPSYMLPSYYVVLERMPLTFNGKVDLKSLPSPDKSSMVTAVEYEAGRNETEVRLIAIWESVLGRCGIGIRDDFFELGGHSLKATNLSSKIHKEFDVRLTLQELFTHTKLEQQASLIASSGTVAFYNIPQANEREYYELSSAQKRLFFMHEFAPGSISYNMPMLYFIGKDISKKEISRSLQQLITRHESLRTSFVKIHNTPYQKVHSEITFDLDEYEFKEQSQLNDFVQSYIRPFDLGEAPLIRSAIINLKDVGYYWIIDAHHIVCDGTSQQILTDDFFKFYNNLEISELKLHYRDFSEWQNNLLGGDLLLSQKQYWLSKFSGELPKIQLQPKKGRPPVYTFEGAKYEFVIDTDLSRDLIEFGHKYRGTLQITMLAVLNVLFYKYTGQDDLIIGCGIAGRRHPDLDRVVGMFVNSIPLRNRLLPGSQFLEFYKNVLKNSIEAYENQDIQFEDIVDMLNVERDPSRNPIFDICLLVQNFDKSTADKSVLNITNETNTASNLQYSNRTAKFDMTWFVSERENNIVVNLEYYKIYDRQFIIGISEHFKNLLKVLIKKPEINLSEVRVQSAAETKNILDVYANGQVFSLDEQQTLVSSFKNQCALTPGKIAIYDDDNSLSYAELERRSDELAAFLLNVVKIDKGDKVGLLLSRSKENIIAILGTLKAGGAYLPLEIDYPEDRLLFILRNAGVKILLTEKKIIEYANRLQWQSNSLKFLVCLDSENVSSEKGSVANELRNTELWDFIGETAIDEISGGGWKNSFTGDHLTRLEMDEYVSNVHHKLKKYLHKDAKVLEIGCSSGLTMFSIAPEVALYVGTDMSPVILANTAQSVKKRGYENILLECIPAHEIDKLAEDKFDLIIINSVVQSFDGHNYLRDVLVKVIGKLNEKGHVFLGDLMDESKRQDLQRDLLSYKLELDRGAQTKIDFSSELFIAKNYLTDLIQDEIGIVDLEFSDKIHTIANELTRYRFDAILKIDKRTKPKKRERNKYQFDRSAIADCSKFECLYPEIKPDDLAYVIYTSGTSGDPKGVMIEHASVVNYLNWAFNIYCAGEIKCDFGLFTSLSFDLTVTSIFLPLLNGYSLRIYDPLTAVPDVLSSYLVKDGLEMIKLTPAHIALIGNLDLTQMTIKRVIVGGEELLPYHVKILRDINPAVEIFNEYGPTETTVGCSVWKIETDIPINIGRPSFNTQIYILGDNSDLRPLGLEGEICIGGNGLARGYLNNTDLTDQKFIDNPFSRGKRIYRTGDLGRWLPDGNIEYLGRMDDQVKIRGHRVELGEVENMLRQHENILEIAVASSSNDKSENELVAYFAANKKLNTKDLRSFSAKTVPDYMIPTYFIQLDKLPLTSNGKVNRKALPKFYDSKTDQVGFVAPRNNLERKVAEIWETILGKDNISIYDDFFSLGGHSLKATRMISYYRKEFKVNITLKDIFLNTTLTSHADIIALAGYKAFSGIRKIDECGNYPLSNAQLRLWLLHQYDTHSTAYNITLACEIIGELDVVNFSKAVISVINRHEILRTYFKEDEYGEIRQWIIDPDKHGINLEYVDFRAEQNSEARLQEYIETHKLRPFDLSELPLLFIGLVQIKDDGFVLFLNIHHVICDGWSMEILTRDLMSYYKSFKENKTGSLPLLPIQYKDYAGWHKEQLNEKFLAEAKIYWLEHLQGELPLIDLSSFDVFNDDASKVKEKTIFNLSTQSALSLQMIAKNKGVSLFACLLALTKTLLYRYTGHHDLIVGIPTAGREHSDLEDQVGFYVNTLALRSQIDDDMTFSDLVDSIHHNTHEAYTFQLYPFDLLLGDINLKREKSSSPLFNIMIDFMDNAFVTNEIAQSEKLKITYLEIGAQNAKFDIDITFLNNDKSIDCQIKYNSDLFSNRFICQFGQHLIGLADSIVKDIDQQIARVEFLNDKTPAQVIHQAPSSSINDLFRARVSSDGEKTALIFGEERLSYGELDARSNQLAHYLVEFCGVSAGDIIGVQLEKSGWLIVAILGILKAGGAYVPIDPDYPSDRISYQLEDSGCKVLIDEERMGAIKGDMASCSCETPDCGITPDDLAYIIYTSGSTGRPKGVMVEHRHAASICQAWIEAYQLESFGVRLLQLASVSFDVFFGDICRSLLSGGTMVLCSNEVKYDFEALYKLIKEHEINILESTPGLILPFVRYIEEQHLDIDFMKVFIIGSDLLSAQAYQDLWDRYGKKFRVINSYGTTETTIDSLYFEGELSPGQLTGSTPIGKPFLNTQAYILSKEGQLQPVGIPGELYIGGSGVSRGYLNRGELTMERFVANPYGPGRLYRTGDLGRWLPDGNIEYLGRMDDQVKIRGYRIELGEIESVLVQHAGISEALVVAREQSSGDKYLAAYYVSSDGRELDSRELKEYLGGQLPGYMVPSAYVWQEQFRLTANGKIDKKSLPEPEVTGSLTGGRYIAPRTEIERALAAVYEEVLGYKPVGIKDDFFELGGDSIKSIQVVSRLRQRGYQLQVRDVLRHPQVGELTGRISRVTRSISQQAVEGVLSLSPIQRSFLGSLQPELHHYNQSVLLYSRERIDGVVLREILGHLAGHHDALRMVYRRDASGDWEQYNEGLPGRYDLQEYDYSGVWEQNEELSGYCGELQSGMELGSGPMLRAGLFHCHDGDRLLLVIHHLVVDGVSWRILFEDLSQLYSQYKSGTPLRLPLKTDSFRYWQQQQELYSQSSALRSEVSYWGWLERQSWPGLPKDYPGGVRGQDQEGQCSFTLDAEQTRLLQTRCHSVYRTEINDLLLTGLGVSLRETFGVDQVLVSLEGHGREEIGGEADVTRTVGWFTTEYPVLLDMSGGEDVESVLVRVKEHLHRVPNKGIGYGILRYMSGSSFRGGQEYKVRPEISFNYLGDFGSGLETGSGERLFEFSGGYQGSTASPLREREESLTVSGIIIEGSLTLSVSYNGGEFAGPTITSLMSSYQATLEELTSMLGADREHHLTPVDLTYQGLSIRDLSLLNRDNDLEDVYPLSPLQEGLYYHWLSDPGSGNYFEQMLYEIGDETLDLDALEKSYAYIVGRHTILRTSFTLEYGEPLQVVRRQVRSGFRYQDVSQEGSFSVSGFSKADRDQGFTLGEGSQMRLTVLRTGAGTYSFVWSHHHILMDGWCVGVIINEFYGAYRSYRSGSAPEPVVPAYPYVNYIKWLGGLDKGSSQRYWQGYLSGYETLTGIPVQGIPGLTPGRHSHQWLVISGSQLQGMRTVCGELGITENTFIQAVWGLLLSRYNNTEDVVFGSVVSGRPGELEGVETMIGLFINTVPVRVRYDHGTGVAELLRGLQAQNIEGLPHHYVQLAEIQSSHELGSGLLDHILVFENYPVQELISGGAAGASDGGLGILSAEVFEQTNYRLTVVIVPSADQIKIDLGYDSGLYQGWFMEQLSGHFSGLVTSVLEDRSGLVGSLAYMDSQEQEKLGGFTGGAEVSQGEETLLDLFRAQVELRGEETAVVFEDSSLTYRELDARSNQLAHYLVRRGVKPGSLVPVCVERSLEMIIGLLGILKSGGAYVPIDPDYPSDRIRYILEDTSAELLLSSGELLGAVSGHRELVLMDRDGSQISKEATTGPGIKIAPGSLAYVIYTSGSTGRPKGVMVEHGNVSGFIQNLSGRFGFRPGMKIGALTTYSFDISVLELLGSLSTGLSVVVLDEADPLKVLSQLEQQGINILQVTPSRLIQLTLTETGLRSLSGLEILLIGGEALPENLYGALREELAGVSIYNVYGPTETTIWSSSLPVHESRCLTIGRPLIDERLYILDRHKKLLPVGVSGEIYIGGSGVSRGYLNRGELTMERFVANPYGPGRLYRTGDLGRWLPDGNIEYLGRMDDQVKIRGYRIELGEIESVLVQHAGISEALVVAREQSSGDKYLAAYYVSSDGRELDSRELKEYLGGQLPGYMVPSAYVWQEQFRLTANGKIDKKSLPEPEVTGSLTGGRYVAPRNEIEERLAEIWQEVLSLERVGVDDDFFEVGGNSITTMRIISLINKRFEILVSVGTFFELATIESLAKYIRVNQNFITDQSEDYNLIKL